MEAIIKRLILFSVFVLPFLVLTRSFYGLVYSKSIFLEGITFLIATLWIISKLLKKNKEKIPKNIVFLVFGAYVLVLIISGLSGVLPALSFWSSFDQGTGVIFMLCLLVFSLIASTVFKKKEDWYKLFTIFVASGVVFTLGSFLSEIGVKFSKFLPLNTVSGFTIGNSSWAGIYLTFVFFISLGLIFSSKIQTQKILGIIGALSAFFNPTLTAFVKQFSGMSFGPIGLAQTASYSMFIGIVIFCLYLIFRRIDSLKWRKVFVGSVAAVLLVGVISVSFIGFHSIRNLIAEKAGPNRFIFWDIAVSGFKEKPILGWGGDAYPFVYGKYFNPIITTEGYAPEYWVDRSHNIYFDELVTGGILGIFFLLSLYGVILFGLIRKAIVEREKEGILYMALFAGMTSFLVQGLMLFQTVVGWFIVALLAVFTANFCFADRNTIEAEEKKNQKDKNTARNLNISLSFITVVIFVILFNYVIIKPYKINSGMGRYPTMSHSQRLEFLKKLDNAYVGNTVDLGNRFAPYHIRMRDFIRNGLKENEKQLMIQEIKEIVIILENGSRRQNYMDMKSLMSSVGFYSILVGMSPVAERQGYYDQGMFYVNKMTEISNKNPIIILSKSVMDVALKHGEAGVNALETDKTKVKR